MNKTPCEARCTRGSAGPGGCWPEEGSAESRPRGWRGRASSWGSGPGGARPGKERRGSVGEHWEEGAQGPLPYGASHRTGGGDGARRRAALSREEIIAATEA